MPLLRHVHRSLQAALAARVNTDVQTLMDVGGVRAVHVQLNVIGRVRKLAMMLTGLPLRANLCPLAVHASLARTSAARLTTTLDGAKTTHVPLSVTGQ